MTAKLYGPEERNFVVHLLTRIEQEEKNVVRLAATGLMDDDLFPIDLDENSLIAITVAELRMVYQSRITDIVNKLKAKNIELANAPDAPLQSIARAQEKLHEEPHA